jgi:SAM-dependent methyltransferase
MSTGTECPLCGSTQRRLVATLAVADLLRKWQKSLGIDIREELAGVSEIEHWRCGACTLGYFLPASLVGSPALYTLLEKFEWYYLPRKWEHDLALIDLRGARRALEIGSGFGAFVERASSVCPKFEGCEQNPSALALATARGLPIRNLNLDELSRSSAGEYDAVCAFQVLEHVATPGDFLRVCSALLKPGGKLMLGLPNAKSFLKHQDNLLDLPPHHMTRWSDEVLQSIPQWFPLRLEAIAYEPLPGYQVEAFVQTYASLLVKHRLRPFRSLRVRRLLQRFVAFSPVRAQLRGQSLYALYSRT